MATQKHTARGPTFVWNVDETIWQPNAKNLKKHLPNAPYAQVNIQPTTRAVQSTGIRKTRKTTWQRENNKFQIDKPSHKITQTIQILSTIRSSISYSQVLNGNNNNQTDNIGIQLNTFLNEFKTMFSQLINQNSMILSMLTTIINNKLNNGH